MRSELATTEAKTKAQACLSLSRCLLGALGNSTSVLHCIDHHRQLIPVEYEPKLVEIMAPTDQFTRKGVERVLERAIDECAELVENKPGRYKVHMFDSVEQLFIGLFGKKRKVINKPQKANYSMDVHFSNRVLSISDIRRIGDNSLMLLRNWFSEVSDNKTGFLDIDISNPRSPQYGLFNVLRKEKVIGDSPDNSPVIKYRISEYKLFTFQSNGEICFRVQLFIE